MTEIILIAAVGKSGQLGLNGGLPWGADFKEDRLRFRNETAGHIIVFGYKTWRTLFHLDGTYNRIFKYDILERTVEDQIDRWSRSWPDRNIFVAGGAKTYKRWLPHITRFDITQLPYEGPADTYFPTLFAQTGTPQ